MKKVPLALLPRSGTRESDADGVHLAMTGNPLHQPLIQRRLRDAGRIRRLRKVERGERHVFGTHSGIDTLEAEEAVEEQPRSGEEHDGQGDLEDHERRSAAGAPPAPAIAGLFERGIGVGL